MQINTTSIHFTADAKLLDYVDKKVNKLAQVYDRITDTQVFLKLENSGQVRDKIFELRLNVPGDTLIAKETNRTFEAATDKAIDNMRRQLKRHKEKFRPRPS